MSTFIRFTRIREIYARILPEWMADYQSTGRMHHDPYFMEPLMQFTPIEAAVWRDIRSLGLPFYPQIPALNYFLDFACPMLKIGIECDGKAWHDYDLDRARDARLSGAGWTIFRIEGHECMRGIEQPWEDGVDEYDREQVSKWFMTTSTGILYAIKQFYFTHDKTNFADAHRDLILSTLFEHQSTPFVTEPKRTEPPKEGQPVRVTVLLENYMARLQCPWSPPIPKSPAARSRGFDDD